MKLLLFTGMTMLLAAARLTDVHAKVDFYDGWESGCWNSNKPCGTFSTMCSKGVKWNQCQMQGRYSGEVVTKTTTGKAPRSGKYMMKYEWHHDAACLKGGKASNTCKKAMTHTQHAGRGARDSERWFAWSVLFPSDGWRVNPGGWGPGKVDAHLFWQLHGQPSGGCAHTVPVAAMSFNPKSGKMSYSFRYSTASCAARNNVKESGVAGGISNVSHDTWYDIVMQVKFSPNRPAGFCNVWINGRKIGSHKNKHIGYMEHMSPFFSIGLYFYAAQGTAHRWIYFDEVRQGDAGCTYEDIAPRGNQETDILPGSGASPVVRPAAAAVVPRILSNGRTVQMQKGTRIILERSSHLGFRRNVMP